MDELRVILLILGAAVIAGVYAWSRLQQRPARRRPARGGASQLHGEDGDVDAELARMERLVAERDAEPELDAASDERSPRAQAGASDEQLLVISVVAGADQPFRGDKLLRAFDNNELVYDSKGIFERRHPQVGRDEAIFGVANLVKPGTFPAQDMAAFTSPGITLFLQLPCAMPALDAFDDFMNTAERLAVELAGELRDEQHRLLTHQALMQVRERLAEAQLRARATAS